MEDVGCEIDIVQGRSGRKQPSLVDRKIGGCLVDIGQRRISDRQTAMGTGRDIQRMSLPHPDAIARNGNMVEDGI